MRSYFLIAFLLLLSSCAQIDNTLLQANQAVTQEDRITGRPSLNLVSRDQEIRQANDQADELIRQLQKKGVKLNEAVDAKNYARLDRIMRRVLSVSHMRAEQGWKLYLIGDPQPNAFVVGGTVVFIYAGMLDIAQSDDELAVVIGHEISHIAASHLSERSGYDMASAIAGSKSSRTDLFQESFTVTQEREADTVGILYVALAGYDPESAPRLWQKMRDKYGDRGSFISDHPVSSDRMRYLADYAEKVSVYYKPGQINPNFAQILDDNVLWHKDSAAQSGVGATLETVLDYFGKRQQARAEAQNQTHRMNIINGIQSNLGIAGMEAVSDSAVRVDVTPKANFNGLTRIDFAMVLPCSGGKKIQALASATGKMRMGQVYPLLFRYSDDTSSCDYRKGALRVDSFE